MTHWSQAMPRVWIVSETPLYADLLTRLFLELGPIEVVENPMAGVDVVVFLWTESVELQLELLPEPLREAKLIGFAPRGDRGLVCRPRSTQWEEIRPFGLAHIFLEVLAGRLRPFEH